ncbi:hypothetical protein VW35_04520 [Devosia soli]|uniref:Sulphotransferase Stf0 domain-containing protein n=2 Tax=Devosia soli TaxID=361041 RepID=A0A0F5LFP3_9HYPH|nr:hypothetical protein VW35_04520 [Devosia soli]
MANYSSYIICGTPRSGSTLLCEMLAASGTGKPNSYFRAEDFGYWAERWGVTGQVGVDSLKFEQNYFEAMLREGRNGSDIFGLRLMWNSVDEATRCLQQLQGGRADFHIQVQKAFGPTLFIHLSRADKLAQAISLVRARQSGLWHIKADGSVMEGDECERPIEYDRTVIANAVAQLEEDDAAWTAFFCSQAIEPVLIAYSEISKNPQAVLAKVLERLGKDPKIAGSMQTPTRKMSDATSTEWYERYLAESIL